MKRVTTVYYEFDYEDKLALERVYGLLSRLFDEPAFLTDEDKVVLQDHVIDFAMYAVSFLRDSQRIEVHREI